MTNYLQLVTLASSFELDWSDDVEGFFEIQETISAFGEQALSFDCFIKANASAPHVVYTKLLIINSLPLISFAFISIVWGIIWMSRKDEERTKRAKTGIISSMVVIFFMFHPVIMRFNFSIFSCRGLGDGKSYLSRDTSIACWETEHWSWALGVAAPGILLWGIMAPIVAVLLLSRSRKSLNAPDTLAKYGFIYQGLKERYYYWEIYIVARKILVISVAVFLFQINRAIQALICFAVFFISYQLQETNRPYATIALNGLEIRSLVVGLVTLYCGLFFLTGDIDRTSQLMLLLVLIGVNLYFWIYWLMKVFASLPSHLKKSNPRLYARLNFLHRFNTPVSIQRDISVLQQSSGKRGPMAIFPAPHENGEGEEVDRGLNLKVHTPEKVEVMGTFFSPIEKKKLRTDGEGDDSNRQLLDDTALDNDVIQEKGQQDEEDDGQIMVVESVSGAIGIEKPDPSQIRKGNYMNDS